MQLLAGTEPPQVIKDCKAEIERRTRLAELQGDFNRDTIDAIVALKLRLDGLYMDWAEGLIP